MKKKLIMLLACWCLLVGNIAYADGISVSEMTQTSLVTDTNVNRATYEHGKVIGHYIEYAKDYVDKGVQVIVKIYVNLEGKMWFSDAYGNLLK